MKLFKYIKYEIISILLLIVFNYFALFQNNIFKEIYNTLFLFIIPGFILIRILKLTLKNIWEYLLCIVGLSTSFILFGGLIENFLLKAFYISRPLELQPLLYFFDVFLFLLIFISIFIPKKENENNSIKKLYIFDWALIFISSLFVVLAVFGSISLNNGGSNLFIVILLTLIPIVFILMVLLERRINENAFCWFILTTSISLLLMLSLRSWHISGSDINEEFRIFQLTKNSGFWNPHFIHPYNACLTLTILPTIISIFTNVNDEYIYKLIMQIIFALTPLSVYFLYRNFANKVLSLLAVFYIMAQPFFIQPMTSLIRQEVALFFFSLCLWITFNRTLNRITASILFIIFGASIVVSHYSTTYISIGIFTSSFIFIAIFNMIQNHSLFKKLIRNIKLLKLNINLTHSIDGIALLTLIAFTYFWFFQFTQTGGNITGLVTSNLHSFQNIFKEKRTSDEVNKALSFSAQNNSNSLENINLYVKFETEKFSKSSIPVYKISLNQEYLYPIKIETVPSILNLNISNSINIFLNVIKLITKITVFLGALYLLIKFIHKDALDKEYVILNIIGLSLIVLVLIHPTLGQAYNLSRVYLQILIIAALGGIIFLTDLFYKIPNVIKYALASLIISIMFIFFSGLSAELTGGVAYLQLHNYGDDYDKFYTRDTEVASAKWLAKNYDRNEFIFTDNISNLRLQSFANISNAFPIIVPGAMYKNSYVYTRFANIKRLRTDASIQGLELIYSFPLNFLNNKKNLIYNNGESRIYK